MCFGFQVASGGGPESCLSWNHPCPGDTGMSIIRFACVAQDNVTLLPKQPLYPMNT